ncbi:MAG: hypothetical protein K0R31_90 [Clostridiales bacterium]|jgi:hypothetical protein|nr:hypothetical protein [Clostridiales bacterium]
MMDVYEAKCNKCTISISGYNVKIVYRELKLHGYWVNKKVVRGEDQYEGFQKSYKLSTTVWFYEKAQLKDLYVFSINKNS